VPNRKESTPDPMQLEAELAARLSVMPLVSQAISPPNGDDEDSAPTMEAQTAQVDTHSPPCMVQLSFADAEASGVDSDPELLSSDGLEALPLSHTTDMSASRTWASDAVVPACATVATAATAPASVPTVTSIDDFISSISSNLSTPILTSPSRLRVSQVPDYSVIPRRSTRLKASNPEV
jgi:hypothetical protein